MTEPRIGRVLPASLHQAISESMPTRLEFYEHWLHPTGLHKNSVGVAQIGAVLSFLRQEGERYDEIMALAGRYAATWTADALGGSAGVRRWLPARLRARRMVRTARALAREVSSVSRLGVEARKGSLTLTVDRSIFCDVRERGARPLCGFYAAAVMVLCERVGLGPELRQERCRAVDAEQCVWHLDYHKAGDDEASVATLP